MRAVLEALEGYKVVKIDASNGWAIGWGGGTSFDAVRLVGPDAGLVVSCWNLEGDDDGRVTTDEAIDELADARSTQRFLHVASSEQYYVPDPDESDAAQRAAERNAAERLIVMEHMYKHDPLDADERAVLHDSIVKLRRKLGR